MSEGDELPEQPWRPLSRRDDPSYEADLFEGVPSHMRASAFDWTRRALDLLDRRSGASGSTGSRLTRMLRLQSEFSYDNLAYLDDAEWLDLLDALLRMLGELRARLGSYSDDADRAWQHAERLAAEMHEGGSAWEVGAISNNTLGLRRRVDESVTARAEELMRGSASSARHLRLAWHHLYGRSPDPSQALDEAVKAIEAAGKPVISPANAKATLGTMIADLRNKPEKWVTSIGTVDQLRERLAAIWTVQPRHGTDDPNAVTDVPPDVAEAAVHDALSIVHAFERGLIRPAP